MPSDWFKYSLHHPTVASGLHSAVRPTVIFVYIIQPSGLHSAVRRILINNYLLTMSCIYFQVLLQNKTYQQNCISIVICSRGKMILFQGHPEKYFFPWTLCCHPRPRITSELLLFKASVHIDGRLFYSGLVKLRVITDTSVSKYKQTAIWNNSAL